MTLEEMARARLEEVRAELAKLRELEQEEQRLAFFVEGSVRGHSTGVRQRLRDELTTAGGEGVHLTTLTGGARTGTTAYNSVTVALHQMKRLGQVRNSKGRWYIV